MKISLIGLLLLIFCDTLGQSIYKSVSSKITFFAGTLVEDIDAENTKAMGIINLESGEITISIPNKEFHFKRALMEEHFNENYMESDKFPKSEFKGIVQDPEKLQHLSEGNATTIVVVGVLDLHGIKQKRSISVEVQGNEKQFSGKTTFPILLADHHIDRPKILWEKLAETVNVTATFTFIPYKNHS